MSNTSNAVNQIVAALMVNLSTIQTHAATISNLTDATNALQENWSNRIPDLDHDDLDKAIQKELDYIEGMTPKKGESDDDFKKRKQAEIKDNLVNKYMLAPKGGDYTQNQLLSHWSSQAVTRVQGLLSSCYDKDGGPPVMGVLSSFLSMVGSESTQELTPMQSLVKSEGSIVQQDASAQQPLADAGNSFVTLLGSTASFLQQSYY